MKKIVMLCLTGVVMTQLVGCGSSDSGVITVPERPVPVVSEESKGTNESKEGRRLEEQDFLPFFRIYFSLTEEDMLFFNQNPTAVNNKYWDFREEYILKVRSLLGEYLSHDALAELGRSYMNRVIDFPKKLEINEYVTYGSAKVEKVEVLSMRTTGENKLYEVAVTTENDVKDVIAANKEYVWDNEKMYYAKKGEAKMPVSAFDTMIEEFETIENSYLFAQDPVSDGGDEIKLVQKYWIEVVPADKLEILNIQEATPVYIEKGTRQKATNIKHVERIPYYETALPQEVEAVKNFFSEWFNQPKSYFEYLKAAYLGSFESFKQALDEQLEASAYLMVRAVDYKQTFHESIFPYKDLTKDFKLFKQNITIISTPASTKKQPRYQVYVPVETIEADGSVGYFLYEYFVGFEQGKIEVIQFVARHPMTEEGYKGL